MKILIVGAGIAGPTAAFWLAKAGHEVTIVEHAKNLRTGGYVIDFWGAGFDVAEMMGIVPQLREVGYVMNDARAVNRDGRRIASIVPAEIMKTNERYLTLPRSALSSVIYESLGSGVESIMGNSVSELVDTGEKVRVTFSKGGTRDFDLVLGADGLHSQVRRLAFGPDENYEKYLGMVFAAFDAKHYPLRDELVAMMHAEVGFQSIRLSLRDDETLFLVSARHDGEIPEERKGQEALLRSKLAGAGWEVPAMLDAMPQAATFYFDRMSQIRMPSWSKGRIALIGDAGCAPSFLAGQGSALAMIEAYTLATELAISDDHAVAFDKFEKRLRPLVVSKQDAALGLGLAFAPKNRRQLFVRNAVMKVMSLPKIADLVMGKSFHDRVELPAFPQRQSAS